MYIILGLVLSFLALWELTKRNVNRRYAFIILAVFMTAILCFRYGQGTDYINYYMQYRDLNIGGNVLVNSLYHGEFGWYILLVVAKSIGLSFEFLVAILSFVMMVFTLRAINNFSPYKTTSLLLLYPTFFMTYFYSAIRQGFMLSLFLGLGLNWLLQRKWIKYYVLIFLLALIHTSAIILALIPVILYFIKRWERDKNKILVAIIIILAIALFAEYSGAMNIIGGLFGISGYLGISISVWAIVLRVLLFLIIYFMHRYIANVKNDSKNIESVFFYIYTFGFLVYILLAFSSTLSQRITMPLKAVEILLIPIQIYLVHEKKKEKGTKKNQLVGSVFRIGKYTLLMLAVCVVVISDVELFKNVDSYISQGKYYSWVTPLNYPYINIFDEDAIHNYRPYSYYS